MSTLRRLLGDRVVARDGVVGSLDDVYFDDERWTVRYLVVDSGGLAGRLLVPPQSVEPGLSGPRKLRLALLSRQVGAVEADYDRTLRSGSEVIGYAIEARDGAAGEVQDLVFDDTTWDVSDVVVDTRKWWPGGHVRVHPRYVERIDCDRRTVRVRLTREQVKLAGAVTPRR